MKKKDKQTEVGKNLALVYSDLMKIEIKPKDSFKSSMKKFYEVMRKHGIKQGVYTENGSVRRVNPEWNLCYNTFKINKISALDLWFLLSGPPEDLIGYPYE